jgi:phosphinothricin acetyltransferase
MMERGHMRIAAPADAAAVAEIYARYVRDTVISFELEPPDAAEMAGRIETTLPCFPWLVWEMEGQVAGYTYASAHRDRAAYRWSVDTTVYVAPFAHRRGVGMALSRTLARVLALQGFYRAYAGIALPNDASVALHEAVGYQPVGVYRDVGFKLGAWRDVGWWGLDLAQDAGAPGPIRPFSEALFDEALRSGAVG